MSAAPGKSARDRIRSWRFGIELRAGATVTALAMFFDFLFSRVRRLTSKQKAQLPAYRERWRRIALSTEPADRGAARMAIDEIYRLAGLPPPETVIFLDSPLAGALGAAMLRHGNISAWDWSGEEAPEDAVEADWLRARDGFRDRVREQVLAQTASPALRAGAPVDFHKLIKWPVDRKVEARVRATVRSEVWGAVELQVDAAGWDHVWDYLEDMDPDIEGQLYFSGYGLHDADWLSLFSFFHEVCGLRDCAPLAGHFRLAECCGWWWPFENAAILTERPCLLNRDREDRLHCADGPAVAYPDGWGIWAWHGVRVPQHVIEAPEDIAVEEIEGEENIEMRRVMIERVGAEIYLERSGAEEVARDEVGVLYRKELAGDEPLVMVKVRNSSPEPDGGYKDYFLRVPPDIKTPREAVAWSFGLEEGEYKPGVET